MWRSTAAASTGLRSTTKASGSDVRTWPPGPTPRPCWPLTCWPATKTPDVTLLSCCAGRWRRCRPRRGPGVSGYARTQAISPDNWPARLCSPTSSSPSAPGASPRLWRLLDGIAETDWTDALDMPAAQVAVADYCPNWWPAATRLLIRRVRLDVDRGAVSADPRARRRRTLHPDQRTLPLAELADLDAVYGYSFIVTNLEVSTSEAAAQVEHWYRHRTQVENVFRDAKHGAALRHLPSGYLDVNRAWMWGALLAASLAGWLHQLTATPAPDGGLLGHGRPRRPGHDRHPAAPTDPRPRPPRSSRGRADPAPATRPDPARRDPGPYPRPSGNVLTTGRLGPEPPGTTPTRGDNRAVMLLGTKPEQIQDRPAQRNDHPAATRGFGSEH